MDCKRRPGPQPSPQVLCSSRDGWFWKGTRTPSSPWVPQHQCGSPPLCGLYKKRSPIFRMGGAACRAAGCQWPARLVLEGKLSCVKRLFLAPPGPPPAVLPSGPHDASDLWSQNPCCALRSRENGMDRCLSPGFHHGSLTPGWPSRKPSIHPPLAGATPWPPPKRSTPVPPQSLPELPPLGSVAPA